MIPIAIYGSAQMPQRLISLPRSFGALCGLWQQSRFVLPIFCRSHLRTNVVQTFSNPDFYSPKRGLPPKVEAYANGELGKISGD